MFFLLFQFRFLFGRDLICSYSFLVCTLFHAILWSLGQTDFTVHWHWKSNLSLRLVFSFLFLSSQFPLNSQNLILWETVFFFSGAFPLDKFQRFEMYVKVRNSTGFRWPVLVETVWCAEHNFGHFKPCDCGETQYNTPEIELRTSENEKCQIIFRWALAYLIPPRVISKFSNLLPCNQFTVDESIDTCRTVHINSMVELTW